MWRYGDLVAHVSLTMVYHLGTRGPTGSLRRLRVLTLACALLPCTTAAGQAELQGKVFSDSGRRPVPNAEVAIPRLDLRTLSDSLGRYRLPKIPRGDHLVVTRAVGYRPDSAVTTFDGDETLISDVVLQSPMTALPTVAVREASNPVGRGKMSAYEARKSAGIGHFLDRELFAKAENRRVSEILASNTPGVSIHRGTGSKAWAASGRSSSSAKCAFCRVTRREMLDDMDIAAGAPLACYMDVYLDGALVYDASARKTPLFDLNSIGASEIEAVELYSGASQVPAQFNKTSGGCGVMLIWTRTGR